MGDECKFALCDACNTIRTDARKLEEMAAAEDAQELEGDTHLEENLDRMQCNIVHLTLMSISLIALEQLAWSVVARSVIYSHNLDQEATTEDQIFGWISATRMTICERTFVSYMGGVIAASRKSLCDKVQLAWSL